jgi:hypothetical protein
MRIASRSRSNVQRGANGSGGSVEVIFHGFVPN